MNWISRAVARDTRAIPLRASSSSNSAHMAIYAGGYGDYCSAKVLA
jgi:hypothetical protein